MPSLDDRLSEAESLLVATRHTGFGPAIDRAVSTAEPALATGHPLLVCGNGGSAADAQHIVAELVGGFLRHRRALRVILTAWSSARGFDAVFARQVVAHGEPGDVLLALSTSGIRPR
jgi:D-sedoheptulose 7-phosphate isomerase